MKKFFIFAMLLAAGTLAFNSCNNKKDEPKAEEQEQAKQDQGSDIFKGMEFRYDYIDDYNHYNRMYFIFGQKNDFEWGVAGYKDEARTQKIVHVVDFGTYEANSSKSTIYLNCTDGFYFDGVDTISHGPNRKPTTFTYSYGDDVLSLTDDQGKTTKYDKQ